MRAVPLPDEPDLDQLRRRTRELQRAVRAGDPDAIAEVAARVPGTEVDAAATASFRLSAAQLVVARRHGFASWTHLRRRVEIVQRYSRFPNRTDMSDAHDATDQFLRAACLNYEDDGPTDWAAARALLGEQPAIGASTVHTAAATADAVALTRILARDPADARREGGPYRWEPLMYLAYARHDPAVPEAAVLSAARVLLGAGADPNAGYLWHGLLTPFTVLTGVFGEGELGPERQPRHPHSLALARVLLEAGADPNDGQALYNRMFRPDDDHLELLFEFGLGAGTGGPWYRRLGDALDPPAVLVHRQLAWAISHGMTARVALLADRGADLDAHFDDGTTPVTLAATTGHPDLADYLVRRGARPASLDPPDAFVAAALAGDRVTVDQLRRDHPRLVDDVRAARPGLMAWAASTGRAGALELLVELGFDVNAMGRRDIPSNEPWQTALHTAAEDGDLALAGTLLRLGADANITDHRFGATPLGWARHFDHPQLVELLEPITGPPAR